MKEGTKYCIYCLITGDNIGRFPCSCSPIGSHRIVIKGSKKYRFRQIGNYSNTLLCLDPEVPEGYELDEIITY